MNRFKSFDRGERVVLSEAFQLSVTKWKKDPSKASYVELIKRFFDDLLQLTHDPAAIPDVSVDLDSILDDRGEDYGDYETQAEISQSLKRAMRATPKWESLKDHQKETLENNAGKISRILNGNPNKIDSWFDQGGYVKLSVDIMKKVLDEN